MALDFTASVTTTGLSQVITVPTHCAGPMLDLVFCSEQEEYDLRVEELMMVPLQWTDLG